MRGSKLKSWGGEISRRSSTLNVLTPGSAAKFSYRTSTGLILECSKNASQKASSARIRSRRCAIAR